MADILVDSDVFVDHLRGHRPFLPGNHRIFYSTITRAELFAGRDSAEEPVRLLLAPFTEVAIDRAVAERGGRLRRGTSISLPDALIAATALEGGMALMTRNVREFERIEGLKLRTPA